MRTGNVKYTKKIHYENTSNLILVTNDYRKDKEINHLEVINNL